MPKRKYNVAGRQAIEREVIRALLENARGNIAEAARQYGVIYDTLYKKVKRLGLIDYAAQLRGE